MRIKIWGARGSLPTPQTPQLIESSLRDLLIEFLSDHYHQGQATLVDIDRFLGSLPRHRFGGYGGNTLCVAVQSKTQEVFIDGGSGIRLAGYEMMNGPLGHGKGKLHILFTHFHWDHLMGLPFLTPIFIPGNEIHMYAVQPDLEGVIRQVFSKPFFPVPFDRLESKIIFHRLEPRKEMVISDMAITPYELDHPDPCWGFKIKTGGRTYSHCVDTECLRSTRDDLGADLPLYQNVDLMLFDAQYTLKEAHEKVHWGHASAVSGLEIGMREGIRKMLFLHHDPASSNEKIADAEAQAAEFYKKHLEDLRRAGPAPEVQWAFAYEGMTVQV